MKIMSFAYADRSKYLGDQEFFDAPVENLISKEYAEKISKKIKSSKELKVEPGIYFYEEIRQRISL